MNRWRSFNYLSHFSISTNKGAETHSCLECSHLDDIVHAQGDLPIVDNFHVFHITIVPDMKQIRQLIIDANAMLASRLPLQSFESVAGRYTQLAQRLCSMQHPQLPQCNPLNIIGAICAKLTLKDLCRFESLKLRIMKSPCRNYIFLRVKRQWLQNALNRLESTK